MFLPYFVSYVLLAALVYNLFNFEYGVVNNILISWGQEPVDVYSNPGIWKQSDFPAPVGIMARQSRCSMIVAMTSACPGRNDE